MLLAARFRLVLRSICLATGLLLATAAQAQAFSFTVRVLDALGRGLYSVTGNNDVAFAFTNVRTGERQSRGTFSTVSSEVAVSFSQAVQAGDVIRLSVSSAGSAPTSWTVPGEVVVSSEEATARSANRTVMLGGPPAVRQFRFTARLLDLFGRSVHSTTGNNGLRLAFTNERTGETRVRTTFDTVQGDVAVDFTGGGNQSARLGDRILLRPELLGSASSYLCSPESYTLTNEDLAGERASQTVTLAGMPALRTMSVNCRLLDPLGRSLHSNTGNADLSLAFVNLRTGERRVRTTFDTVQGDVSVDLVGGGNQSAAVGDRVRLEPGQDGTRPTSQSFPATLVVTDGNILSRSLGVTAVAGGLPSLRSLPFTVLFLDPLGRSLFSSTGNSDFQFTLRNQRTGETRTKNVFDTVQGHSTITLEGGGNQSVQQGDLIVVSARLSGSTTTTLVNPAVFALTPEDLQARAAFRTVVAAGRPLSRNFAVRLALVDALGRNLFSLTGNNGIQVLFTNLRSRAVVSRTSFDTTSGLLSGTFATGGNQAAVAGDEVQVSIRLQGVDVDSWPSTILLTGGDFRQDATPYHRVTLTCPPFERSFGVHGTVRNDQGGLLTGQPLTLVNTRTGETRTATTAGNGTYSVVFTGTATAPGASLDDRFTVTGGPDFIARSSDILAGSRALDFVQGTSTAGKRLVFEGTVEDSLGRPVPAATLTCSFPGAGQTEMTRGIAGGDASSAGRFLFVADPATSTPPTTGATFEVTINAPGHAVATRRVQLSDDDIGAPRVTRRLTLPDLTMTRFTVSGRVSDGTGRPVTGFTATATATGPGLTGSASTSFFTTDLGVFSLELLANRVSPVTFSDRVMLTVTHPALGSLSAWTPVTEWGVRQQGAALDIHYPNAHSGIFTVAGTVQDALGRPIDGARVTARNLRTGARISANTPSDTAAGSFRMVFCGDATQQFVTGDRFVLTALAPSFAAEEWQFTASQGCFQATGEDGLSDLRLVLTGKPRNADFEVRGRLRNHRGSPLQGAVVGVLNTRTGRRSTCLTPSATAPGSYRVGFFDPSGDAVREGDELFFGSVSVLGLLPQARPASLVVTSGDLLAGGRAQDLEATVVRTSAIQVLGRVLDRGGSPLDGAAVALRNPRLGRAASIATPSGETAGSFLFSVQDFAVGAASAGETFEMTASAGGESASFRLVPSEREVLDGRLVADLPLSLSTGTAPVVVGVTPSTGSYGSSTPVTLAGSGLLGAAGARLEDAAGTPLVQFLALSDRLATAVVPAGVQPGSHRVTVYGRFVVAASGGPSFTVTDPYAIAPVARAALFGRPGGAAQVVRLDGTASSGESLDYAWSLAEGPAGARELATAEPTVNYSASAPGRYLFRLAVRDRRGRTASTTATIEIAPSPPVAVIRTEPTAVLCVPDLPSGIGCQDWLLLDGTGSYDPSGQLPVELRWSLLSAPPGSSVTVTFDWIDRGARVTRVLLRGIQEDGRWLDAGLYEFALDVTGSGGVTRATRQVQVLDPNRLQPRADAGPDQAVLVRVVDPSGPVLAPTIPDPSVPSPGNLRAFIRLDGRGSTDPAGRALSYEWTLLRAPPGAGAARLGDARGALATLVTSVSGDHVLRLRVANGVAGTADDETTIHVRVAGAPAPPNAEAFAREPSSRRRGSTAEPLRVVAGRDTVELDAGPSTDPDARTALTYAWTQVEGPPVELVPSTQAAVTRFIPPAIGLYRFSLTVRNALGAASSPFSLSLLALEAGQEPPVLSVISSASTTTATGQDYSPADSQARPRSLRVRLPSLVTLSALAGGAGAENVDIGWEQVAGPTVLLSWIPYLATPASAVAFEPTTPQVHLFRVRAAARDAAGQVTGVSTERLIRVIVDGPERRVPEAAFRLVVGGRSKGEFRAGLVPKSLPVVRVRAQVTLDGRLSRDLNEPPRPLAYHWVQADGPQVVLSDPTSSVTTFAIPELGDLNVHQYSFQLFVDNGDRSEPAPGALQAAPDSSLAVGPGLNLVSVPLDPSTAGHRYDAADLMRDTGAVLIARSRPSGGFEAFLGRPGEPAFPIEGGRGYIVVCSGQSRTLVLDGAAWGSEARTVDLTPGANLIGYPLPIPVGATLETLRAAVSGSLAAVIGIDGKPIPYLREFTLPPPVLAGQGILLVVPASATLSLPAGP